jgi:hypothetical protein
MRRKVKWRVLHRVVRGLLLISVLVSVGTHTVVLQTVAWTKMAVEFSQRSSLQTSLTDTFDGRHPCSICRSLKSADSGPSLAATPRSSVSLAPASAAPHTARVDMARVQATRGSFDLDRADEPLSPPPNLPRV